MDKIPNKTASALSPEEINEELKFWQNALKKENQMLEGMISSLNALEKKMANKKDSNTST